MLSKKSIFKKRNIKNRNIFFENRKFKKIDQVTPAKERASAHRPPVLRPGDLWGSFRDAIRPERPSRALTRSAGTHALCSKCGVT